MPRYSMADGREFTNYEPSCQLNKNLQSRYNVQNSHEYRYFLQQNGSKVMMDMISCVQQDDCLRCPVCQKKVESKKQ